MIFFENKSCEHYPCHELEEINCIFCYCPLYQYEDCGGNYKRTKRVIKDCSDCVFPHMRNNKKHIDKFLKEKNDNFK